MKSLTVRLLGALLVLAALTVGVAPAASASAPSRASISASVPDGGGSGDAPTSSCSTGSVSGAYAASSPLLPVNRWADATSNMHSRLDNAFFADTGNLMNRNMFISNGMSTGNFMWSAGTQLSAFAINFCILDSMGGAADGIGATIGNALLNSGLLVAIVVISVAILLFQARRRGGAVLKTLVAKGALVGLLSIMVAGSMNSTGAGLGGSTGPYKPGLGSPGWVVTTLNKTVSSLASAPAAALAMPDTDVSSSGGPLSCSMYLGSLNGAYKNSYGKGPDQLSAGVPLIMSRLWEQTGLQTWRMAQFGTSRFDENAYCHLLDWNAGVRIMADDATDRNPTASSVRGVMSRIWAPAFGLNYNSSAWRPSGNVNVDRSLIGWSTCYINYDGDPNNMWHWGIQPGFQADNEKKVSSEDCKNWFTGGPDAPGALDWTSNGDDAKKRAGSQDLGDYILTLHGNYNYQGMTSVIAYNLSALSMLVVFGLVSLSIIVAKVAMIVMIISAFFLVLMALLPSSGMDKLSGFVKMILGMNIFIFGIQLVFALIAALTNMLQSVGGPFLGGPGSLISTLWAGGSPLIAVYLLHMMFTKVMKVPSPFKLSAGLAWGTSAAAVGGATAAGVGSFLDRSAGRHGAKAMGAAKRTGSRGLNSAMSAASGGRLGAGVARKGAAAAVAGAGLAAGAKGALGAGSMPAALAGSRRRGGAQLATAFGAGAAGGAAAGVTESILEGTQPGKGQGPGTTEPAFQDPQAPARTVQSANPFYADGKLDHMDLVNSNVPNSQLTRGRQSATDRKAMRGAQASEQLAALAHEKQRRSELGLKALPDTKGKKVAAAFADTWSEVSDQYHQKPIRTVAKGVALGAVAVAATPAIAFAPLLVPAGVAIVAGLARTAGRSASANTPGAKRARMDERTMAYRETMRKIKHPRPEKEAGPRPMPAAGGPSGVGDTSAAAPPEVAQKNIRPAGPAGAPPNRPPATERLPIV